MLLRCYCVMFICGHAWRTNRIWFIQFPGTELPYCCHSSPFGTGRNLAPADIEFVLSTQWHGFPTPHPYIDKCRPKHLGRSLPKHIKAHHLPSSNCLIQQPCNSTASAFRISQPFAILIHTLDRFHNVLYPALTRHVPVSLDGDHSSCSLIRTRI